MVRCRGRLLTGRLRLRCARRHPHTGRNRPFWLAPRSAALLPWSLLARVTDLSQRGLVLVDVVPQHARRGPRPHTGVHVPPAPGGFSSVDDAAAAIARFPAPSQTLGLRWWAAAQPAQKGPDGRLFWHWDPAFHASSKDRAAEGMLARMERAACAVRIPTLLISGSRSEVVNQAGINHLLGLIPQATSVQVADAAHTWWSATRTMSSITH